MKYDLSNWIRPANYRGTDPNDTAPPEEFFLVDTRRPDGDSYREHQVHVYSSYSLEDDVYYSRAYARRTGGPMHRSNRYAYNQSAWDVTPSQVRAETMAVEEVRRLVDAAMVGAGTTF